MRRIGGFLLRHPGILRIVHRPFRHGDDPCPVCRCAFAWLLTDPEFVADLEAGG